MNEVDEIRKRIGLSRMGMLRAMGSSKRSMFDGEPTSTDLLIARRVERAYDEWLHGLRAAMMREEPFDAWEFGHLLGVSAWHITGKDRLGGWLDGAGAGSGSRGRRYTLADLNRLIEANANVPEDRHKGPLAGAFMKYLGLKPLDKLVAVG